MKLWTISGVEAAVKQKVPMKMIVVKLPQQAVNAM